MRKPAHRKAPAAAPADGSARAGKAPRDEEAAPGPLAQSGPPAPGAMAALQRAVGNAAVARMLSGSRAAGAPEGSGGAGEDPPVQRSTAHQVLGSPGQPLDASLRSEMEGRLGADFSDVRVHTGSTAQRSADELGARAYTSGNHVVLPDGGRDKHTLAHELTHVIQQRQGPVSGTDSGDGLRVSDPADRFERAAEANARRVMSGPAVQRSADGCGPGGDHAGHDHAGHDHGSGPGSGHGQGVVQRKGHEELTSTLPAATAPAGRPSGGLAAATAPAGRPAGGLFNRFRSSLNRSAPEPVDPLMDKVRKAFKEYDEDRNRDTMHCLMALTVLQHMVAPELEEATDATRPFLTAALQAVDAELTVVRGQINRDDSLPAGARAPFGAMTDKGMLWNSPDWEDSAVAFSMRGASYFRELSEMNRHSMGREINDRSGGAVWVADVRSKLATSLRQSVLTHYTPKERAEQMLAQGNIKSKTELLRANPDAANNSEPYDKHVLANEGFVFFFLEVPNSPFRETRFGGSEPARIEIPLTQSPLMTQGWLMLSDFAQREYPTLRADPSDPARTQSQLPTREDRFGAEFTAPMRKFALGSNKAGDDIDFEAMGEAMSGEADGDRRGQIPLVLTQAHADKYSEMTYGSGAEGEVKKEKLRSNTLMGADIVPGLVERAIVEIIRLEQVNPQLATRLKGMSGDELMRFLLKDLLRPQAMLPNSVDLSNARGVLSSGAPVTVPTQVA
ncbi:DUF4157 domain-containing protein [Streptomyces sp. NPDC090025]|uniref:DUF4157 domain-containing protein n=1 Tax=Streptomyces sp. NPDC090025 TaxID=3365922 RepID=UPI0038338E13